MKMTAPRLLWPLLSDAVCCMQRWREARGRSCASRTTTAPDELAITELAAGSGDAISPGSVAVVHYTGWLYESGAQRPQGPQVRQLGR